MTHNTREQTYERTNETYRRFGWLVVGSDLRLRLFYDSYLIALRRWIQLAQALLASLRHRTARFLHEGGPLLVLLWMHQFAVESFEHFALLEYSSGRDHLIEVDPLWEMGDPMKDEVIDVS